MAAKRSLQLLQAHMLHIRLVFVHRFRAVVLFAVLFDIFRAGSLRPIAWLYHHFIGDTWIENRRQALSLPPYFCYGGLADVNHNLYELSSWEYSRHGRQIIQTYAHMIRIIAAI